MMFKSERQLAMKNLRRASCGLFLSIAVGCLTVIQGQTQPPIKVSVNGVELNYVEGGRGETVILLHGGTGDYRSWSAHWDAFVREYHVISYSRRFHYPNNNAKVPKNYSAINEAEDLAALIDELKLGRVHLVGASYGAYTALAFALEHPKMVRSLVLAEPPLHSWMKGTNEYKEFMDFWEQSAEAFRRGDQQKAMRIFATGLFGPKYLDQQTPATLAAMMQNARALGVLALSTNPFPELSKEKIMKFEIPTIIVTGANTIKIHRAVDDELARIMPNAKHFIVPNSGHAIARDNPEQYRTTVLEFLRTRKKG
jgi:pimeloyl-ACP methyl ester carboxylesterase